MPDPIKLPGDTTISKNGIQFRISFDAGFGAKCNAALSKAQTAFSQEVAKTMDKYVPFRNGPLKNSVITASNFEKGELVYNTPYARAQYYLHESGSDLRDGVRGSYWGQRCIADNKDHFEKFARDALGGGLK